MMLMMVLVIMMSVVVVAVSRAMVEYGWLIVICRVRMVRMMMMIAVMVRWR